MTKIESLINNIKFSEKFNEACADLYHSTDADEDEFFTIDLKSIDETIKLSICGAMNANNYLGTEPEVSIKFNELMQPAKSTCIRGWDAYNEFKEFYDYLVSIHKDQDDGVLDYISDRI